MTELRDPALLEPGFRTDVDRLLAALRDQGYEFRISTTLRTPWQQSRLWRQSRTRATISDRVVMLRSAGAEYLAHVLESVGPQSGKPVTNALPGMSWHQWGLAVDAYLVVDRVAVWDAAHPGYIALAITAESLGLTSGRSWGDAPHVQARMGEPRDMPLREVDAEMAERFGLSERDWLAKNAHERRA
jgi:hypothetical protein